MSEKAKGERKGPEELKFVVEGQELKQSEIVKVLRKLGGVDLTSTQIRDELGLDRETGRGRVRAVMARLIKAGVVTEESKPIVDGGKRTRYHYSLVEEAEP